MGSNRIVREFRKKLINQRRRKWYYSASVFFAAIVVFCTVYALILPAITQERPIEPSCGISDHEHTAECYSEWQCAIEEVVTNINNLPSLDEIQTNINAYDESGDEDAYEQYFLTLQNMYNTAYASYTSLNDVLKPFVTNASVLESYSWLSTETLDTVQSYISIQYRNYFDTVTTNSGGRYVSIYNIAGQTASCNSWWKAIVCTSITDGVYQVSEHYVANGVARDFTVPANGFVILYHYNYKGNTGFHVNADVGDFMIIRGNVTVTTVNTDTSDLFTIRFIKRSAFPQGETYLPKDYKDNSSNLTIVNGADTNEFIELNLYDYGDDINELFQLNNEYPGFQQSGGTYNYSSFTSGSMNFGDIITADLKAGLSGVTSTNTKINKYTADSAFTGIGSMRPVVNAMGKTLGEDGYPCLANGLSLGYLFGQAVEYGGETKYYATKMNNNSSINGLFQLDDNTGIYYYNSHNNHAQFVSGDGGSDDTFVLYEQVISPNFIMYPFGNFFPLNDIVNNAKLSSQMDRTYFQSIAASAAYKALTLDSDYAYNNNSSSTTPYASLGRTLRKWIADMDTYCGYTGTSDWTAKDAVNAYFRKANIKDTSGNYITFTNEDLNNIYTIDFDEESSFFFGMEMKMKFVQSRKGITSKGEDMILRFMGDDDVWIYVDGVLFLDLSGIHRHTGGEIDFKRGEVRYYDFNQKVGDVIMSDEGGTAYKTVSFASLLTDAGVGTSTLSGGTFEDYSVHTLNFYYMERGSGSGVCRLEFNMEQTAPTGIYKVDQYGAKVPDAVFAFYAADEDFNYLTSVNGTAINSKIVSVDSETGVITFENGATVHPLYTGVTDSEGEMLLVNEKGQFLAAGEIRTMLGEQFILREIYVPDGYRTVGDEIQLYFDVDIILCKNIYESGAWISQNATVRANETLEVANPGSVSSALLTEVGADSEGCISYYQMADGAITSPAVGTLFAVVLKRNGKELNDYEHWYPVIGNDEEGYQVKSDNTVAGAIAAAKTYFKDGKYTHAFDVGELIFNSASGVQIVNTLGMVTILKELPGDPTLYYSYIYDRHKNDAESYDYDDTEYIVAYYYSSADTLENATEENTVRISTHKGEGNSATSSFTVQWTATIEVPNVIDTLYFQKVNSDEELVDYAVFGLYNAVYDETGLGYYIAYNGTTPYYVLLDTDGETARLFDTSFHAIGTGKYVINEFVFSPNISSDKGMVSSDGAGLITVTCVGSNYIISPAVNASSGGSIPLVGYTHTQCDLIEAEGTGHFMYLYNGNYFIKELLCPEGYEINTSNIKVSVIGEGVYANAGTTDNGVKVGNGAGYVVKTLDSFASVGDISETLSWIYGMLRVNDDTGFLKYFDPLDWDDFAIDDLDDGRDNVSSGLPQALTKNNYPYDSSLSQTPMTMFLVYDGLATSGNSSAVTVGNPLFDYVHYIRESVIENIPGSSSAMYALWTTSGWSDFAIYQDTPYGVRVSSDHTGYTILADQDPETGNWIPYNISQLFSSSTYVRVTDERIIDIQIEKVDVTNTSTKLSGASFVLYRKNGEAYEYYSYDSVNGVAIWNSLGVGETESNYKLTTDSNGIIKINGIKEGNYLLKEIVAPSGYELRKTVIGFTVCGTEITWVNDTTYCSVIGADNVILQVKNSTGYKMPETGGGGTKAIYLTGVALTAVALVLLLLLKRKKLFAARSNK